MNDDSEVSRALGAIVIPHADDVRGNIHLPRTLPGVPDSTINWRSSDPSIVSDADRDGVAAGVVTRPAAGSAPVEVVLSALARVGLERAQRDFVLTVRPRVELVPFSRYGMTNFARSNSHDGQQLYFAVSEGNDPTAWRAVNNGRPVLRSTEGMHGVRDPSIVRSPEGDRFYLVATDLNVDATDHGWRGWDWAQSGASRFIEVWESTDLRTWSQQRHILVAPEEAGMAFAPEAIWDDTIGEYVVFWTSSMYPQGTRFSPDRSDPLGRYPLTRNQTLYATTRDFVTFSPARTLIDRPGSGTLDAYVLRADDGSYHRFVCDRVSTGVGVRSHVPGCGAEDIYHETADRILAPPEEWTLVAGCITYDAMGASYAEAPMAIRANPGDVRGGYYLWADQIWPGSPAGEPGEEQLTPYWVDDISTGRWDPIPWQTPDYDLARGVIRHGGVFALTKAEHAALRGADPVRLDVRSGGEETVVEVVYSDGVRETLEEGFGGYERAGGSVSYTVAGTTVTAAI